MASIFSSDKKKKEEESRQGSSFGIFSGSQKQSTPKQTAPKQTTTKQSTQNNSLKGASGRDSISAGAGSNRLSNPAGRDTVSITGIANDFIKQNNMAYARGDLNRNSWATAYKAISDRLKSETNDKNKANHDALLKTMQAQGRKFFSEDTFPTFGSSPIKYEMMTPEKYQGNTGAHPIGQRNDQNYLLNPQMLNDPASALKNPNTTWGKLYGIANQKAENEKKFLENAYNIAGGAPMSGWSDRDIRLNQNMWNKMSEDYQNRAERWTLNHPSGENADPNVIMANAEAEKRNEIMSRPDYEGYFTDQHMMEIDEAKNQALADAKEPKQMPAAWQNTGVFGTAGNMASYEMGRRDFQRKYVGNTLNEDWESRSQYKPATVTKDLTKLEASNPETLAEQQASMWNKPEIMEEYQNIRHEAINGDQDAVYYLTHVREAGAQNDEYSEDPFVEQYMTDEERQHYNYLWGDGTAEERASAQEFVDGLNIELWRRAWTAADEATRARLESMPGWALVLESGIMAGIGLIENQANSILAAEDVLSGRPINPWRMSNIATTTNEVTDTRIRDWADRNGLGEIGQNALSMIYQGAYSGIQSGLSIGFGGLTANALGMTGKVFNEATKYFSLGLMSSGAGSQTLQTELMQGVPQDRAILDAIAAGGIEFATEMIGMDNLFNGNWGGKSGFVTFLKQALAEGSEELVGDIASDAFGMIADIIDNTNYSELNRQANAYILENGLAPDDRDKVMAQILTERLADYAIDFGVGSVSTVFGEGSIGAMQAYTNASAISSHVSPMQAESVWNYALENLPEDSVAYKRAAEVKDKFNTGAYLNNARGFAKDVRKMSRGIVYEVQSIENNEERKEAFNTMLGAFGMQYILTPDVQRSEPENVTGNDTISNDAVEAASRAEQVSKDNQFVHNAVSLAIAAQANMTEPMQPDEVERTIDSFVKGEGTPDLSNTGLGDDTIAELNNIAERRQMTEVMDDIVNEGNTIKPNAPESTETAPEAQVEETPSEELTGGAGQDTVARQAEQRPSYYNTLSDEGKRAYNQVMNEARARNMPEAEAQAAFQMLYDAGTSQIPYLPTRGIRSLSEWTRNSVYGLGYQESLQETKGIQNRGFTKTSAAGVARTSVVNDAIKAGTVSNKTISVMDRIGKMMGVSVNLMPTMKNNGEYRVGGNTINIALDSWFLGKGRANTDAAVLGTFGHELTHRLQDVSADLYRQFSDQVAKLMGSRDFSAKVAHAMQRESNLTPMQAQAEVIANFVGMNMFEDATFADRLLDGITANTAEQRTALQGIRDFVQKVLSWIRGNRDALKNAKQTEEIFQNLETSLTNLIEQSAKKVSIEGTELQAELEETGVAATDDMAAKFSVRTWETTDIDRLTNMLREAGFTKTEIKSWINDVNGIAATVLADRTRLDYDADEYQTALKPNAEYYYTLDLSTLCKKRRLYQGTYNAIMKRLGNRALLPEDTIALRALMAELNHEVPCAICYEESRKKNEGKFAERWLNGYGKRWRGYKNMDHADPYIPTLDQVTTTDGRAWLRENHPEALESYLQYQKTRGSANPKVSMTHTEYRGEIMNMSASDVDKVKHIGGLRLQSFSDFETVHVIDLMQAVMDMASRRLTAQAYTKVPAFADIFGGTGIKINLSLIGEVDENGVLQFDKKEGIDPDEAFRLRDKYSDNVGTILVGANDASILAAWADPRIDMVIPFHRSGWSKKEFEKLGLTGYKDFTRGQTERYLMGKKDVALSTASKQLGLTGENALQGIYSEDYWDPTKTGKENAEAYLQLCAEKHYRPVFYQFLHDNGDGTWSLQEDGSTDGYWKSLVDFKMYDNNGIGAPQQNVRPIFDMEAAQQTMSDFDGNPNTLPVAQDVVDKFVSDYETAHPGSTRNDVRNSARDSEGNVLSDGQQNYFSDSKVRDKDGNLLVVYHGTNENFDVFKADEWSNETDGDNLIKGYFSEDEEFSKSYGDTSPYYLNITNPLEVGDETRTLDEWKKWFASKGIKGVKFDSGIQQDTLKGGNFDGKTTYMLFELVAAGGSYWYGDGNVTHKIQEAGYDGIRWGYDENAWMPFQENAIKRTDNQNPTENKDIRYSVRTAETGYEYVSVDNISKEFEGLKGQALCNKIEQIINEQFSGKVIGYKENTPIVETRRGANEYANSERRTLVSKERNAKFNASKQLDELLKAAYYYDFVDYDSIKDDHPEAINGLSHFEVFLEFDGEYYKGMITILNQKSVRTFYDVTRIKNIPATDIRPSKEGGRTQEDVLNYYLPQNGDDSNQNLKKSARDENTVNDYADIIARNQQREQARALLGNPASWRQSNVKLDAIGLRKKTIGMLNQFGDLISANQREKVVKDVAKLANDMMHGRETDLYDIEMRAANIASNVVFFSYGAEDAEARNALMDDPTVEAAIDNITDYILANIASTQSYQARELQKQTEKNKNLRDTLDTVRQKRDTEIRRIMDANKERQSYQVKKLQKQIENNQKLKDLLKTVREKRDAEIRRRIEAGKERQRAKQESELRKSILKRGKRLEDMTLSEANQRWKEKLIGDMNLDATHLTAGQKQNVTELLAWAEEEHQNNPNFNISESIRKYLTKVNQKYLNDIIREDDPEAITKLRALNEALKELEHAARNENRLIDEQNREDLREIAYKESELIDHSRGTTPGKRRNIDKVMIQGTLSPMRFVRRLVGYAENSTLAKLAKDIDDGGIKKLAYMSKAVQMFDQWMSNKKLVREWTGKNANISTYDFIAPDGKKAHLELTPGMRMTLYLASKDKGWLRHMVGADTPKGHLDGAGIVLPDMRMYKKGKVSFEGTKKVRITKTILNRIIADMSSEERKFADKANEFFNGMQKDALNSTSQQLIGRDIALVDDYLPISVDKRTVGKEYGAVTEDGTVTGIGSLNERVESGNAVLVQDLTDILNRSIDDTSSYIGYAIPVHNFNKVMNARLGTFDASGQYRVGEASVTESIDRKWGQTALDYIHKMLADIQHPANTKEDLDKAFAKIRSNYARAVLTLNLSVGLKQSASYPTAAAVVGWKALSKAFVNYKHVDIDLIRKYTPLLWYRSRGFVNPELGTMKNGSVWDNLPKGLDWITLIDFLTTRKLWKAAEYYVQDAQPNLYKPGAGIYGQSNEYYEEVAKVYNQVIEETQPNYTPWQRPQYLRSHSGITQTLMMFKTQPMQNFNVLYDAVGNYRAKVREMKINGQSREVQQAYKEAGKKLRWAITSQIGQLVTFAAMTMLWNIFRRKKEKYTDEDGNFSLEVLFQNMGKDIGSGVFGMIPFGSDAWSFISSKLFGDKYYGFESVTDSVIGDLMDSVGTAWDTMSTLLTSGEKFNLTTYKSKLKSVGTAVTKLFGIPAENVYNIMTALYKRGRDMTEDRYMADVYALAWDVDPEKNKKDFMNIAYRAYNNGDMESFEDVKDFYRTEWEWSDDTINENLRKNYASQYDDSSNPSMTPSYQHLYELYKTDEDAYLYEYNKMEELGFSENQIKTGIENCMKEEAGVNSVEDLEERFVTPEEEIRREEELRPLHESTAWKNATDDEKASLEDYAGKYSNSDNVQWTVAREGVDAGALTYDEYMQFLLALSKVDQPTESGNYGSYTIDEVKAAIDEMGWSSKRAKELWQYLPKSGSNNPYETVQEQKKEPTLKEPEKPKQETIPEPKPEPTSLSGKDLSASDLEKIEKPEDVATPESSWITNLHYDPTTQTLVVDTIYGRSYTHHNISKETYEDFKNAPSKGNWYNDHLK